MPEANAPAPMSPNDAKNRIPFALRERWCDGISPTGNLPGKRRKVALSAMRLCEIFPFSAVAQGASSPGRPPPLHPSKPTSPAFPGLNGTPGVTPLGRPIRRTRSAAAACTPVPRSHADFFQRKMMHAFPPRRHHVLLDHQAAHIVGAVARRRLADLQPLRHPARLNVRRNCRDTAGRPPAFSDIRTSRPAGTWAKSVWSG